MRVDFLPRQYQITMSPDDFLELILGLRQYLKEFDDGTFRIGEILEIFEAKYVGDLPQKEEEVTQDEHNGDTEGGVGGPTRA